MNGRADLLRALADQHRAIGEDPAGAARLADLLGYGRSTGAVEGPAPPGTGRTDGAREPSWRPPGVLYTARRPVGAWAVVVCEPVPTDPDGDAELPLPLPQGGEETPPERRFLPAPALRSPGQWQTLWDRVVVGRGRGRRIDLARCLRDLSRARPVDRLPLLPRRHFNGPITLVIDRPSSLRQAHGDMLDAWRSLSSLVGRQGLAGFQLRRGPGGDWERIDETVSLADERDIVPGSQVLLLGAFGALDKGLIRSDWQAFISRLKARGHRVHLLPVCHLHAPPAEHTPLDPRQGLAPPPGAADAVQALLATLARCWKSSAEQLRYLRHALPGAGLQVELEVANHPSVIDHQSHVEIDPEHLGACLRAFAIIPVELRRDLALAIDCWRETRNGRAREMERLQAGLLESPSPGDFPRLLRQLAGVARQGDAPEEIPIGLAAYLPLLDLLSKQPHDPAWNRVLRLARRVARVLGEPLPGGYHAEEFPEPESAPQRWLCEIGRRLKVRSRSERALLALGANPYSPASGRIVRRTLPVSGSQSEIMDRGWHYRLRRQVRPAWAERIWQDRDGVIHLAHAAGAVFALDSAGPKQPRARWRCVDNPWPWAADLGVDDYGLWAEIRLEGVVQRLRWIVPGTFEMGSPEDEPERAQGETQHTVTLTRGYWLADTACTQALWEAVTGENPVHFEDDSQNPVENVSWDDCQGFLRAANERLGSGLELRLPTEAEWEYACRAGSTGPFWWGDGLSTDRANYDGNHPYNGGPKGEYRQHTVPVRSFEPNPWGLFQMHGNVLEWCGDWLGDYPEGAVVDPGGPEQGHERVLRGGSWNNNGRNLRSAYRNANEPDERNDNIGLRLAGALWAGGSTKQRPVLFHRSSAGGRSPGPRCAGRPPIGGSAAESPPAGRPLPGDTP